MKLNVRGIQSKNDTSDKKYTLDQYKRQKIYFDFKRKHLILGTII